LTFQFARKLLLTFSDNPFTFIGKSREFMLLFFTCSWNYADKKGVHKQLQCCIAELRQGLSKGSVSRIPHPLKSGFCFCKAKRPIANMQGK